MDTTQTYAGVNELTERDKELLLGTEYVVEANSNETQMLWERYSHDALYRDQRNVYKWEQINPGCVFTIGHLRVIEGCSIKTYPVNICCFWNLINGALIMFWASVGMVSHYDMIKEWLKEHCAPEDHQGSLAHTNAMNFHLVLRYIKDKK